ncbi:MAG: ABC transporter substrate-binding protein [Candidatus Marinimicrobia bacterium]|nr:ABC transporter substrate-binding protein [Candidatus Neomarinimicrobiota bacterium]
MKRTFFWMLILGLVFSLGMLGCAKKEKEIKIGVITPLTGGSAKYGEDIKRGYDLAVEEINEKGGIEGRKINFIYEDSEGKPEKAVAAAQKLIQRDKVITILGALWSSPTLAVAPIANKNKVILLSSGSSSPKVTDAGDYIFRNEVSDEYGAEQTANLFFKLGFKKIAILYVNNDFGIGQKDVTQKAYSQIGGSVVGAESFEQDAKDFRTQLLKIKEKKFEALLIVGYKETILILQQMRELGMKTQILSVALFQDFEILEKVGDIAEGAIYTYCGTFDVKSQEPKVKKFVEKFKEKYHTAPEYYAPLGYDAVKILTLAIEKGGFGPEQIKNALYKIKNFPGLTGTTSFDKNGDVIKPFILKTVKNGEFIRYEK